MLLAAMDTTAAEPPTTPVTTGAAATSRRREAVARRVPERPERAQAQCDVQQWRARKRAREDARLTEAVVRDLTSWKAEERMVAMLEPHEEVRCYTVIVFRVRSSL